MRRIWTALALLTLGPALGACTTTPPTQELALADVVPTGDVASTDAPLFTVYFDIGSAALNPAATAILDRLAKDPARAGWTRITLAGHADRSGSTQLNQRLAAARVAAVRDYLIAQGVSAALISTEAVGRRPGRGPVDPDDRRVEIFVTG